MRFNIGLAQKKRRESKLLSRRLEAVDELVRLRSRLVQVRRWW